MLRGGNKGLGRLSQQLLDACQLAAVPENLLRLTIGLRSIAVSIRRQHVRCFVIGARQRSLRFCKHRFPQVRTYRIRGPAGGSSEKQNCRYQSSHNRPSLSNL